LLETLSINIIIVEKGKPKSISFLNPLKVTKTRLDKESYYSTSWYSIRVAGSQESGIVVSKDKDKIL
jgi:hypothetical protein